MIQFALIISSLGIGVIWGFWSLVYVFFLSDNIDIWLLYTLYLPGRLGIIFIQSDLISVLVSIGTATLISYILLRLFAQTINVLLHKSIRDRKVI